MCDISGVYKNKMKKVTIRQRRRTPRIVKKKSKAESFQQSLKLLNRDFTQLFTDKKDPTDVRLMHRVALNVQQVYFDAKQLQKSPKYHKAAEQILQALTTPWGAPFVLETTLLDAAENLSTQDPKYSDMQKWLKNICRYGHYFPQQILSGIRSFCKPVH